MILVTGGAGFIRGNFVHDWIGVQREGTINLNMLVYARNLNILANLARDPLHIFVHGDICDQQLNRAHAAKRRPHAIVNFSGESHVRVGKRSSGRS